LAAVGFVSEGTIKDIIIIIDFAVPDLVFAKYQVLSTIHTVAGPFEAC